MANTNLDPIGFSLFRFCKGDLWYIYIAGKTYVVAEDLKIINFWEQVCLRASLFAITYFGHVIRLKKVTTFINCHPDPSWHLHDKSQYWKHQNNVWNLFKINNKDTRCCSHVFIVEYLNSTSFIFPVNYFC